MKITFTFQLFIIFVSISFGQNNSDKLIKNQVYFKFPSNLTDEDYLPKTIIFKIKPEHRSLCNNSRIESNTLNKICEELNVISLEKKFPDKKEIERGTNERGEKLVDLSLIYKLSYDSAIELEKAINHLYDSGIIEYAEPYYIPKLFYTSNDPENSVVYALAKMKVYEAWDISEGDTNVVIGITDTGVDFEHPDLKNNIKYNYNDPMNGIDDDADGYIDNLRGWDVGQNDNNPQYSTNDHGVQVSGIAAASTNNGVGISGVAFKCKFLPVKIANANGALTGAYDGIVYAADHGCQIINCSWGGYGGQFGQDIINYATFNQNALVVCGAGNDDNQRLFYPASFNNALTVASTARNDIKSGFSNYGYHIDISAPGTDIYTTLPGNTYDYVSGTSMSSPNVAGAAAVVKSHFPSYTALQVGEQLKVTADKIYNLNNNTYRDKLGTGRINLFRALTDTTSPSVVMTERTITINNGNSYHFGDTLVISGEFLNYLTPTVNLTADLTTTSAFVNIINGNKTLGTINTYETVNISNNPLKVVIKPNAPLNFTVSFKLTLTDGSYSSRIYFDVDFNLSDFYVNVIVNDVQTSVISSGKIGYLRQGGLNGLGYIYMGSPSMLHEAGLMLGNSAQAVSSSIKGSSASQNDFSTIENAKKAPNVVSEFDVKSSFNDNNSANPLNVIVKHTSYAWSSAGNRKFVIFSYTIKNMSSNPLDNLYAGIYADWNIMDYTQNKADFDAATQMGYVWSTQANSPYTGIKLLSSTAPVNHYAIDNIAGANEGIDISDGFNIEEKYTSLSSNRNQAGVNGNGADVVSVVSAGPYDLLPGDSAIVAFALLAGDSLEDLQANAVAAQDKYDLNVKPLAITSVNPENELWMGEPYPNPAYGNVTFEFILPNTADVRLTIYNIVGQKVNTVLNKSLEKGKHNITADVSNFTKGIYLYKLTIDDVSFNGKMNVVGIN